MISHEHKQVVFKAEFGYVIENKVSAFSLRNN